MEATAATLHIPDFRDTRPDREIQKMRTMSELLHLRETCPDLAVQKVEFRHNRWGFVWAVQDHNCRVIAEYPPLYPISSPKCYVYRDVTPSGHRVWSVRGLRLLPNRVEISGGIGDGHSTLASAIKFAQSKGMAVIMVVSKGMTMWPQLSNFVETLNPDNLRNAETLRVVLGSMRGIKLPPACLDNSHIGGTV